MAILPTLVSFWVPVRNYWLEKAKLLVQSPNVDLKAQVPRIIIRSLSGEYIGDPRVLDSITALQDDTQGRIYRNAAHGVRISPKSGTDNFPVWVCLERNESCREQDICIFNPSNLEFSVAAITSICWVPTHEAANGDLYTVIGTPGRHGYEKELRLPTIVQRIGCPGQAKLSLPPSSLSGLTKLEPARQEELFNQQYNHFQKAHRDRPTITLSTCQGLYNPQKRGRSHGVLDGDLELPGISKDDLPSSIDEESSIATIQNQGCMMEEQTSEGLCRCPCTFSDLGPTCFNPLPLHRHVTDDQCTLGSTHELHCIFAAHRPEHCVISGSKEPHEHCLQDDALNTPVNPRSSYSEHRATDTSPIVNDVVIIGTESGPNYEADHKSSHAGLERLSGTRYFHIYKGKLEDQELSASNMVGKPKQDLESSPISPLLELSLNDEVALDTLPDPALDPVVVRGPIWNVQYHVFMTPEPPELPI